MSWTEEDIRAVMDDHRPGNEGFCLCAWGPMNLTTQIFDADHLIDLLGRKDSGLHACNCLGDGGACWHCYQGEHDECTSDQHGRGSTKCTLGRTT